jgi:hypothetical protein
MTPTIFPGNARGYSSGRSRCFQCGGSGLLRVDDQRFRTCLDCLGQGRSLPLTGDDLFFRVVSGASVSAAR